MAFPPSVFKTFTTGEVLTATDLNSSFAVTPDTNIPEDIDDYSVNATEMQSTVDPYPAGVASLATTLAGEMERIRYVIKQITGETQWYIDPDVALSSLATTYLALAGGTMTGVILQASGSESAPPYSFTGDTDCGLYRIDADRIGVACGGVIALDIAETAGTGRIETTTMRMRLGLGTELLPNIADATDTNTGIFLAGSDVINLVTGGTSVLELTTGGIQLDKGVILGYGVGTAATPTYAFTSDADSGMYLVSAGTVGIAVGGVNKLQITTGALLVNFDGTSSAAAFTWNDDTDTGMYRYGANSIGFIAEGADRLRIDNSATARDTSLGVYDVDNTAMARVSVGADDSGGAGFKVLRIPN